MELKAWQTTIASESDASSVKYLIVSVFLLKPNIFATQYRSTIESVDTLWQYL